MKRKSRKKSSSSIVDGERVENERPPGPCVTNQIRSQSGTHAPLSFLDLSHIRSASEKSKKSL